MELCKTKKLKDSQFTDDDVIKCANEMIENMMKQDPRKGEGYKLALMLCLKILENEGEGKVKQITKLIKNV